MVTLKLDAWSADMTEDIYLHIKNSLRIPIEVEFRMVECEGKNVVYIEVSEGHADT